MPPLTAQAYTSSQVRTIVYFASYGYSLPTRNLVDLEKSSNLDLAGFLLDIRDCFGSEICPLNTCTQHVPLTRVYIRLSAHVEIPSSIESPQG